VAVDSVADAVGRTPVKKKDKQSKAKQSKAKRNKERMYHRFLLRHFATLSRYTFLYTFEIFIKTYVDGLANPTTCKSTSFGGKTKQIYRVSLNSLPTGTVFV
jgi:hypothetical protein